MASRVNKGKEVAVSSKGLKRINKGVASSKRQVFPENWTDEGYLALKFSTIHDTIRELGMEYVFAEPE
ncbi:hypothetical protein HAX54_027594, partial [Datura stramonium]|nr:hypothetical protein [Datura stramonium]